MKNLLIVMPVVAGIFLSGCATGGKNRLVLETVGPSPDQQAAGNSTNGVLLVYSAYEVNADFAGRDRRSPEYSDYKIFTTDGRLLKKVHNNSGTILQDAVPVELAPGKYNVRAHSNGYGYVTIPVIVEARQNTVLHLEGDGFWPDQSGFNQTNAVRFPDGVVIGWKAPTSL